MRGTTGRAQVRGEGGSGDVGAVGAIAIHPGYHKGSTALSQTHLLAQENRHVGIVAQEEVAGRRHTAVAPTEVCHITWKYIYLVH